MPFAQHALTALGLTVGLLFVAIITLLLLGLIRPFSVPTGSMSPTVSAGDHVWMENLTYLARAPRRGDIVVFATDGITALPRREMYIKRIAGEPGEPGELPAATCTSTTGSSPCPMPREKLSITRLRRDSPRFPTPI